MKATQFIGIHVTGRRFLNRTYRADKNDVRRKHISVIAKTNLLNLGELDGFDVCVNLLAELPLWRLIKRKNGVETNLSP